MPRGLSSTVLPAAKVTAACFSALASIEKERAALRVTVIEGFRKGHWFMSREQAEKKLPPHMLTILEEYRRHDRAVLEALQGLSKAAHDADASFTVEITADDFRLLKPFYQWGKRNEQAQSI